MEVKYNYAFQAPILPMVDLIFQNSKLQNKQQYFTDYHE